MAARPYIHSAPMPAPEDVSDPLHLQNLLGPPNVYIFPRYTKFKLIDLLRQWINERLPDDCPIRALSIYHYTPMTLYEHYGIQGQGKPLFFFSHLISQFELNLADRNIQYNGAFTSHWVRKTREEIWRNDVLIGYSQKFNLYADSEVGICFKTKYQMEMFTLLDDVYTRQPVPIVNDGNRKFGNWGIVKLSITRSRSNVMRQYGAGCGID